MIRQTNSHIFFSLIFLILTAISLGTGCQTKITEPDTVSSELVQSSGQWPMGVTYEIFVQSFADSDGDGIGDIRGMTSKLDYLADLGIEAVWLMPVGPSPSYHKYDVTDYRDIHPDYGTLDDFKEFVNEAHRRNIQVIIDLVINHSGSGHPWFKASSSGKENPYRDYYVWASDEEIAGFGSSEVSGPDSDNRDKWNEAEGSEEKYYSYFGGHMPDLNYDHPKLREEVIGIGEFWLRDVGVDGFRLDAARHIYPDDRATDNHAWWKEFRAAMEKVKPDVYLVGEVWAESEVVAPYMAGLHALFNFDLGYSITRVLNTEQSSGLVESLKEIRDFYASIEPDFIDATFLTNHDQNRIRSAVGGSLDKARLGASILMTLPGSPYIYYGEEIGMLGEKPDPNIREPFLWEKRETDDRRASWIEPEYSTEQTITPLSGQKNNDQSLFHHYKSLIQLRKSEPALYKGDIEAVKTSNPGILAYIRLFDGEEIMVIHNLTGESVSLEELIDTQKYSRLIFQTKREDSTMEDLHIAPYSSIILK